MRYKHLFFDLDHTIWDFDKNTSDTLSEIIDKFNLSHYITSSENFIKDYNVFNDCVWELYRNKKLTKEKLRNERFRLLLAHYKINDLTLVERINKYYVENSPNKPAIIKGAKALLKYLRPYYRLYVISNGFYEIQQKKLMAAKLDGYFNMIFTSDRIGAAKPNKDFFTYAIKSANAKIKESLVIGDDISNDISGAQLIGIDQVWFNPQKLSTNIKPTYIISSLSELKNIL